MLTAIWDATLGRPAWLGAVPRPAAMLGVSGLAPFFGLAAIAATTGGDVAAAATTGLLGYGAIILSFMGGCRWGFAAAGLGAGPDWRPIALSVAPALWAWVALWARPLLGDGGVALALIAGFAALLWSDLSASKTGAAPAWWGALRRPLTAGACLSLATLLL